MVFSLYGSVHILMRFIIISPLFEHTHTHTHAHTHTHVHTHRWDQLTNELPMSGEELTGKKIQLKDIMWKLEKLQWEYVNGYI